jgi:hypothetical protein
LVANVHNQALADPYFKGLAKVEREPSCQPITKMEFEFERRKVTKEDVKELIFREILEYHPQLLKDYMNGTEKTNFLYPRYLFARELSSLFNFFLFCLFTPATCGCSYVRLTFPNLYYTVLLTISEGNLLTWRKMEERVGHKSHHQTGSMFPSQGGILFHCSLSISDAAKFCFL